VVDGEHVGQGCPQSGRELAPLSDVMVVGNPNLEIQPAKKTLAIWGQQNRVVMRRRVAHIHGWWPSAATGKQAGRRLRPLVM
jgi:hypothetical protein